MEKRRHLAIYTQLVSKKNRQKEGRNALQSAGSIDFQSTKTTAIGAGLLSSKSMPLAYHIREII
jgi:hypothetical protein